MSGTNLAVFKTANLPAVKTLTSALQNLSSEVGQGGTIILKMDKTGAWVFGADQVEVQDNSQWAINPYSFVHGYIAWGEGEVLSEKMVAITSPLPETGVAPAGAKRGWELQVGFFVKCLNGEDKDLEARFTTTSVGGKKAVQTLGMEIATQVDKDPANPVPVVVLDSEHYIHKTYGKIFTPKLEIKSWMGMGGEVAAVDTPVKPAVAAPAQAAAAPATAAPAEATTQRRRRRPAAV